MIGAMKRVLAVTTAIVAISVTTAHASTLLDLTTAGSNSGFQTAAVGGSFYEAQSSDQPSGSGVWNPFLRMDTAGAGSNEFEQGYNTDAKSPPLNDIGGTWTHTIQLSALPTVTGADGTVYRVLGLDINQNSGGNNNLLSLNQVQIFHSAADPGATGYTLTDATSTTPPQISGIGTELFRMSNSADSNYFETKLNSDINQGSGHADMLLYINNAAFAGVANTDFITLYSQFGAPPGGFTTNDGYEEWATITNSTTLQGPPTATPEPSTIVGAGIAGLFGLGYAWRKRRAKTV